MANPGVLREWIERLPSSGRYVFTRSDAEAVTDASTHAVEATLRRLRRRGALVSPRRGFNVIVPPEYLSAGCPPATWFVDDLMRHLGRQYYVGLLSAAALHGAGHQQPMALQVIADASERNIEVGRVRIEFHVSRFVTGAVLVAMQTETGTMAVSSPETTAFDLVRFPSAAGYWSNIATVISELSEKLDPARLAEGASRVSRSDIQRLGYLLDMLEEGELANALSMQIEGERLAPTPLNSSRDATNAQVDPRWLVQINDDVEVDL